jgi:alkanesulfonate monooxygenase SsuD/methylene tetrahydromethanopterin reductase-like flavin-dependent oxidoreductase (luciferase family)
MQEAAMKFAITMPPFADFADPLYLAQTAHEAEAAGWDAFFIWDHVFWDPSFHPNLDPWVGLAAAAMRTEHILLGTAVTPLARRRPWKVARETVSLDRLSP